MINPTEARLRHVFSAFTKYASLAVIAMGGLVLFGWLFNIAALKSVLPGLPTMKANTAIIFFAAGLALLLKYHEQSTKTRRLVSQGFALIPVLLGLVTLAEYIFARNLGIDQWFTQDISASPTSLPGRMSAATALDAVLVGLVLLLLDAEIGRGRQAAEWIALAAGSVGFLALIGYLYGVESLYRFGAYSSMALHTALGFTLLSAAALSARPDRGLAAIFTSDTVGGVLLRHLLPVALVVLILLGWFNLQGEQLGYYDAAFGVALLVVSMVVLLNITAWLSARSLNQTDINRQHAEDRFRFVVEAAPTAIVMVNARGRINFANARAGEMFGYKREELLGRPVDTLVPEQFRAKHPGFRQGYYNDPSTRAMGAGRDLFGLHRDGHQIPIEIGLNPVQMPDEMFTMASIIDISERKKMETEVQQSMDDLVRSNKELEQFAYVASHDLQEPLRMVSSYVQLLARRYKGQLDGDADEFIDFAVEGSNRMKGLINDLLAFSRVGTRGNEFAPVRLEDIFARAVANLQLTIEESGAAVTHDPLPEVFADDGQMIQLLQNLIGNALKFKGQSPPKVHLGARRQDDRWLIFVRDNGIGIDPQFSERIFIIFQRLHARDEYPGTGIGLAISRKIVERHGGRIWVESQAGQGATFFFTLQAAESAPGGNAEGLAPDSAKPAARDSLVERAQDLI